MRRTTKSPAPTIKPAPPPLILGAKVIWRAVASLRGFEGNPRRHPEAQLKRLAKTIRELGFSTPILIDEAGMIVAGHGRLAAAMLLGMAEVPTVTLSGLTEARKKALVIADNRLAEKSTWDPVLLREIIIELDCILPEIEVIGFSTGEVDSIIGTAPAPARDPDDDLTGFAVDGPAVSQVGDVWVCGRHRLCCGNALEPASYAAVLGDEKAEMVCQDPPFNVAVTGHIGGRGQIRHREFVQASGELSSAEFTVFLRTAMERAAAAAVDGALHYLFMDWRHQAELLAAAQGVYAEQKALLVWNKLSGGMGSLYRSQHELVAVFKQGSAPHINNINLGATGRYRTNVIDWPGMAAAGPAGRADLLLHPDPKPVGLIADLLRDASRRHGVVLDAFCGSGTILLAAERSGRQARAIELDPLYVDVAVRRFARVTGTVPLHAGTGLDIDALARARGVVPAETAKS